MVKKKNKIVWFAKIWKPPRQEISSFEEWQHFWQSAKKIGKFFKIGGGTYFTLLVHRHITKINKKKSSGATWALESHNLCR